jgi:hypothetical protein
MTTDNFYFYLQNRLFQTSQTGGQRYSDTSPFSIPCFDELDPYEKLEVFKFFMKYCTGACIIKHFTVIIVAVS